MRMFRFFEYVGIATVAFFISLSVGFFAQDRGLDISLIEQAIAAEDALGIPSDPPAAKVHPSDIECMARNIYFEAGNQSKAGMIAVARVVVNRVQDTRFPNNVCDVIYEGPMRESWKTKQDPNIKNEDRIFYPVRDRCQFSWYCDGKADNPYPGDIWKESVKLAEKIYFTQAYAGLLEGATHYHADYVNPNWAKHFKVVARIDSHIFYR